MPDRIETEILVVGAGPAGLAAAVAASQNLHRVVLVDENPDEGGQIWRGMAANQSSPTANFLARLFQANVQILSSSTVFDFESEDTAHIAYRGGHGVIRFQKAILCPGARELFLPFPGWTLPGVLGVGGLQALVKQGLPVRGRRVVVAGSGPLLLAVAKHLRNKGAQIPAIFEQAPPGGMRELFFALWQHPSKLRQAIGFCPTIAKVKPEWWVKRAIGTERLEAVEATNGKLSRKIECDYLACAYGLMPNIELAQLAGCRIENGFVAVDEHQRTSVDRIFCAGEPVAIGGVDAAIVQGTIAGLAASGRIEEALQHEKERAKAADFASRLVRAFALRDEVLKLAEPDTIVCRCEDVRYGELEGHATARAAKLHTRCGMGACQGRICGAACRALFGWKAPTVRPPLVPVPLEAMAETQADSQ